MSRGKLILAFGCLGLAVFFFKNRKAPPALQTAEAETPQPLLATPTTIPEPPHSSSSVTPPKPAAIPSNPDDDDSERVREFKRLARANDTCGLHAKIDEHLGEPGVGKAMNETLYDLMGDPALNQVLSLQEPAALNTETDKYQAFLAAISYMGMAYSEPKGGADYPKSKKLLDKLSQLDPGNAAYLLLKLVVQEKMGSSLLPNYEEEMRKTLESLKQATHYTIQHAAYQKKVLAGSLASAALYTLYARSTAVPYINLYPTEMVLANTEENRSLRHKLGEMMVKPALESKKPNYVYEYDSESYNIGQALLGGKLPELDELNHSRRPAEIDDNSIHQPSAAPGECSNREFDDYIREKRAFYEASGLF